MFIINITYIVSMERVNEHLESHREYLSEQYRLGYFHASGRKVPRDGGVILALASSKQVLLEIIEKDPFSIHKLAKYEIIEFTPTMASEQLNFLL